MEFVSGKAIKLGKVENELDRFVVELARILEKHTDYAIVSGYVAILFGRNRASEDIDVIVRGFSDFGRFAREILGNGYWIMNHDEPEGACRMLEDGLAIRIAKKGTWEPNFEIKLTKMDTDRYSLENRIRVDLESGAVFIGPLELGIAFKLFLSGEKDIEDARFLYGLFREHLDMGKLEYFVRRLKVKKPYDKYLSWKK